MNFEGDLFGGSGVGDQVGDGDGDFVSAGTGQGRNDDFLVDGGLPVLILRGEGFFDLGRDRLHEAHAVGVEGVQFVAEVHAIDGRGGKAVDLEAEEHGFAGIVGKTVGHGGAAVAIGDGGPY